MLIRSASNTAFIRRLAKQGMDSGHICRRIQERLVWHGPHPSSSDILHLLLEMSNETPVRRGTGAVEPITPVGSEVVGSTITVIERAER